MNAIKVKDLTKRFGDLTAVDHLDFEVGNGEIFGFLGPNGAGKTTTARMLTGIIKPDSGQVRIKGIDIQRDPIKAKQMIGVVPELSNAYTDLSAWNNLQFMAQ
ncbi:MAG: ATP-binding cassette domain-containing protein, partial [Gammaproteobacteria bacterium]|nr:ATP-binding cassette domain-containing protein [Gammaproteobacteria bacterium]